MSIPGSYLGGRLYQLGVVCAEIAKAIWHGHKIDRSILADQRGAIAVQFALLLIPILTLAGGALDLGTVYRMRAVLQEAADSASVGAVAQASPAFVAAQSMSGNGVIAAGSTAATAIFNANIQYLGANAVVTQTATVSKSSSTLTSTVTWSASVPMSFLGIIGQNTWTIGGTSVATNSLPQYLDFYLMIDVSGSMGLPSTQSEQTRLAAVNPDDKSQYPGGCVFACHFSGNSGYSLSRNGGNWSNPQVTSCSTTGLSTCIQLRTDAVGIAIQQLLQTAQTTETVSNQYRIGLYPFIAYLETYYGLTANISATGSSSLSYAAGMITSLLDTGANSSLGSGGTHFENAFPSMNSIISSVGTGNSQSSPFPYVFLITDGSQNYQYQWNGNWWGSNSATTLDPSICSQLKTRGIKISILYIPYQTIENPTNFANSEDFYANANIPNIPTALTSCASPNFFFTANTPADITMALTTMFKQAVVSARITN